MRSRKPSRLFVVGVALIYLTTMAMILILVSDRGASDSGQPTPDTLNFPHIP